MTGTRYRSSKITDPRLELSNASHFSEKTREFERTGFHRPLNYYRSLQSFYDLGKAFKGVAIRQPSFFLTGEADGVNKIRAVDAAEMRKTAPGLRGVSVLPNVGHWAHREASDKTNALLLTFLRHLD
jgi:pimeloyl-ACP methyl ester carboxylesterase